MVVAYLAGKKLTTSQVAISSVLFIFLASFLLLAQMAILP